jgi:hypothetical protein
MINLQVDLFNKQTFVYYMIAQTGEESSGGRGGRAIGFIIWQNAERGDVLETLFSGETFVCFCSEGTP